jgi:hypothetical protein
VRVADVSGEEFDIAPRRRIAQICNHRWDDIRRPLVDDDLSLLNGRRKL